ncbi:MAG TPA: LLM class flavin-dependent oxidoreductase [Dehalococcoidia bacterium]|nr:LLM class flavin-dependent oxidoreductase [Dehalococcoidia bacterium]
MIEFGLIYDFRNPPEWETPAAELYAETLDHIQAAEAIGFPIAWLTEHHFIDDSYLPSCLAMAAAVAARTKSITIGTAVLLLPLHDPIRVAEDGAVVDAISGGRLRLGVGLGYKGEEFGSFGINLKHRPRRMDEGIEVIRKAWSEGPSSFAGRHFNFSDISVTPKPVQKPLPEIWVAGRSEPAVRRAAKLGDGLIAGGGPELYEIYRSARAEAGATGPASIAAFGGSYAAEDPEKANAECGPHSAYRARRYAEWYGQAGDLESDRTWLQALESGSAPEAERALFNAFRTPDEVVEEVRELEAAGVTSLLFFGTFPGLRPSATIPYLETLANKVIPVINGTG